MNCDHTRTRFDAAIGTRCLDCQALYYNDNWHSSGKVPERTWTQYKAEKVIELERKLAALREENAELKLAAQIYGDHHPNCDIWRQSHIYQECTCGYWKFCKKCQASKEPAEKLLTEAWK
jgi:hypothetical protein